MRCDLYLGETVVLTCIEKAQVHFRKVYSTNIPTTCGVRLRRTSQLLVLPELSVLQVEPEKIVYSSKNPEEQNIRILIGS